MKPPIPATPKTAQKTAWINVHLLDSASRLNAVGALLIEGEHIADVGPGLFRSQNHWQVPDGIEVIDGNGHALCPGLVDVRVQLGDPGLESEGALLSTGQSALAGGISTMVCLPNTQPVLDDVSVLEFVARRARKQRLAKVWCYGAVTRDLAGETLAEMGLLKEAGAIAFTDATGAVSDAQVMLQALRYAATFDSLIVQHPEEATLARNGDMMLGELSTRLGLRGIPAVAEVIQIERDIHLAAISGARIHFAHVSTRAGIDAIRRAKAAGHAVSCDTAPPYFTLQEAIIGDYRTFAKLSPPLRSEDDRQAVIEGLQDGTIDVIASDHTPLSADSKRLPFAQADAGGVGLETLLAVTLELYHNGHMDILQALSFITHRPAILFGLKGGTLSIGAPADLVLFDKDACWSVSADTLQYGPKNSPFDGRQVQGRVLETMIDGRIVYAHDHNHKEVP